MTILIQTSSRSSKGRHSVLFGITPIRRAACSGGCSCRYLMCKNAIQVNYADQDAEFLGKPTGKFAISGFRVFGKGSGDKPEAVKEFIVLRTKKDRRSAWLPYHFSCSACTGLLMGYGSN